MSRGALWTRNRGIALGEASDWRVPGLDADDVRQEALVALWCATATWDRDRGPFAPYARRAVKNHCADLLRAAARQKRTADIDPDGLQRAASPDVAVLVEHREQLRLFIASGGELVALERRRRSWRESKRRQRAGR